MAKSLFVNFRTLAVAFVLLAGATPLAHAQSANEPYGSAKFSAYEDIESIKELKTVWDFNFVNPMAVNGVFNNIGALMRATSEFGPHGIEPLKIVMVSHGPEIVVFAKQNYAKYKDIVDRAASLAKQEGVRFEICRNAATAQGFAPEDLHGFVHVVPAGPYALAYWQAKGYSLNAVGATMPTPPISDLNKADLKMKPK